MRKTVWEFEHAVECAVPREFAWSYWTDAANWDDPPARFEFGGPFAVGTRLKTILPGQTLASVIREVEAGRAARIEMEVMEAVVAFCWRFAEVAEGRVRITQRVELSAAEASALVEQARVMEQSVPQGMARLAVNMERAWGRGKEKA
jgi:hypothetical protein